ncbi:right-handed parallel beta-helix repeat-containing protein [Thiohalorhabdus denitrificans]|uniref:Right handed beta helix region n=1 Tax=Thiohalorhabdus denitrificans TaxID=381306 RepID=A0A1G5DEV9_9GAMM|nr:right-handed parallel beta-helix repeat-containing protein [Thiohalorhabdus denitrificans]SCY13077.1 Right handed beta helix region [Thiohalorhabdus denitrificans]
MERLAMWAGRVLGLLLPLAVASAAVAEVPADTWVKRDPEGSGKASGEPEYRPYSAMVAGGGYVFYWGGGHKTHGGNDVDAYIPAEDRWVQLTEEEDWSEADSWDHLTDEQKEKLRKARGGGWHVDYLSPRGRPLTAHSYTQMAWWADQERFCISKFGIWCYAPAKGDEEGAWEEVGERVPVDKNAIAPWNLTYDPDLETLVAFTGTGKIEGYMFNPGLGTWERRVKTGGKSWDTWTEVFSVYAPERKEHIVYGAGRWARVDLQKMRAEEMTQLEEIAGSQPQSFSLVWAPELEKALLAARMDGELQLWTYDPEKDVWGRFFLDGSGPTDAHGKWSTLVRDAETGLYVFLAADSENISQIPETWVFRLSGRERKVSRCPYDACVGGRHLHGSLQAALDAAPKGGTVGVAPGTYRQCAVIERAVTIKPLEGRPHLRDEICKGKGVLVAEAPGRVVVEGLEVSGASREKAIWMHQGAGELVLRDLKIHDSGMGVLAVPGAGSLRIYDSEIYAIHDPGEHAHFVYGGENAELVMEGNYLHGGSDGHFIKAKSVDSRIRYNFIHQRARTDANIINIWGCGENQVIGNAIRSEARGHPAIAMDFTPRVNYGEGVPCPVDHARAEVVYNSYLKEGKKGWSALVMDKVGMDLVLKNNLVAGASLLRGGDHRGASLERENARVRGFGDRLLRPVRTVPAVASPTKPDRQYSPIGTEARGAANVMGAYGASRGERSGVADRNP